MVSLKRLGVSCAKILLPVFLTANAARAQASTYVPLDDIAYAYLDALSARGMLRELSALERPFTVGSIRAAIDSARAREHSGIVSSYLDALGSAIEKYSVRPVYSDSTVAQSFRARFSGDLYLTAQTSGRRELMLADSTNDLRPGGAIRLAMAGGPIAGFIRTVIDSRLNVDPEFAGRKDRKLAGRTEDGYVSGQWRYAELAFGRLARNWGPPALYGLMLGNYAYTYDHLYARIGRDRFHWSSVIARLNDSLPVIGPAIDRYFSIHRLSLQWRNIEIAGSESYVYSGAGRGFEPSLVNPFNIYGLSWRNEREEGNLGLGAEMALRSQRFGTFAGQLFIDDLQIDRSCDPNCKQPSSYALTLSGEGLPLRGDQRWFGSYTRVTNLAYRNKNPPDNYEIFGLGLGRGYSDYDEIRAGVDLAILHRAPLRFYAAHRRQGEGSYNVSYPAPADYASTPTIFSGVVMGVTRLGVAGASRWKDFEASGDIGVNHTTNDGHVSGVTMNRFEGRIRMAIEPRWSASF